MSRHGILFVCLGNICRSPTAEAVFTSQLEQRGRSDIDVDSAGTIGYHTGAPADARMRQHAARRGYTLTSRARRFDVRDFERFTLVVAMDQQNLQDLAALDADGRYRDKLIHFCAFTAGGEVDVPDPYYGGAAGFEKVLDLVEEGCEALLEHLLTLGVGP